MRKNELDDREDEKTENFVKKNWPKALMIAGAAGVIGAAIWLTARYLREQKRREQEQDEALSLIEKEVEASSDEAVVLLETGPFLADVSGEEGKKALSKLADHLYDEQAKEALKVLKEVIDIHERGN